MIPVINGVTSAAKPVESLVSLGLQISKSSGYSAPKAKTYLGRSQSH
jgi:Asp/Glu/hydantoin racemase